MKQKDAERLLRESEERYRAVTQSATDAIVSVDSAGNIVGWNRSAESVFGYSESEVSGQSVTLLMPSRFRDEHLAGMARMQVGGEPYLIGKIVEMAGVRKDGSEFPLELSLAAWQVTDGRFYTVIIRDITERKRAEESLKAQLSFQEGIVEYAAEGICVWHSTPDYPNVSFTVWNNRMTEITGHSMGEINRLGWYQSLYPDLDVQARARDRMDRMRQGDNLKGEEWEITRPDGAKRLVSISTSVLDERDKSVHVLAIIQDITERKQAETYREMGQEVLEIVSEPADLHDSIQRVITALKTRTGFDAVGIRLQDERGFPFFAQEGFSRDFLLMENMLTERAADGGLRRDQDGDVSLEWTCGMILSGKSDPANPLFTRGGSCWTNDSFPLLDIPPGEDSRRHPCNRCVQQGYASVALVPIRNMEKIVGMIQLNDRRKGRFALDTVEHLEGIASHIGAALMRRQAEEVLRESEYFFKESQRAAFIGSYKNSFKTGYWESSEVLDTIFGIDKNYNRSVRGWLELVHPDDREMMGRYLRGEDITIGKKFNKEYRIIRKSDGEIRWVMGSGEVSFDSNGTAISMIGTVQDITERKRAEKALLESERLSAIGEMSSGVAHDFNNSLQVIFGNLELALLVPNISPEVAEFIDVAKKSVSDTASRIRQLLHFTKKESNVEFSALDLNNIIDEAIFQTRPLWKDEAEKKGLQFSFQKNYGKICSVDGEPGKIGSIFHNLVKNAVEAMPHGGTITFETGVTGNKVYVRISDTGIGMDEETRMRIFQPFFTTKGFELGRGLGMSSVYSLMREHDGNISIKETALGKGTTIEMVFPFGTKNIEGPEKEVPGSYQISARVLWVDDEEAIINLGKMFLERLGHFADVASSGKETLELLEKNRYDLLITDVGMPGMSGWQLAETIKGRYQGMKIAVVTGWGADVSNEEKAKHGVGYVLGKPISMMELKNLIGEILRSKV